MSPTPASHYRRWANAAGLSQVTVTSTSWCYADDVTTRWWGAMWAERAVRSDFATRARVAGVGEATLTEIAAGWTRWSQSPGAMIVVPSSELIARP